MKIILILVAVMFCSSESFRVFHGCNTLIRVHLKSFSAVNQSKTIGAAATGCLTCAGGAGSKNVFTYSNPSQSPLSGGSSSVKVFSSNSVFQKKCALLFKLLNLRSFMSLTAATTSRTVLKAEGSTILSTMYRMVDDMNEIEFCQTVCK
jgi:hypothetical protein